MRMSQGRFSRLVGCRSMPPAVNVVDFLIARSPELKGLYEDHAPKFPEIPRNKRRRLRSYKPYFSKPKMPKRAEKSGKISRRTSRFKKLYIEAKIESRQILPATHLWHAKRFHMDTMWDMRLPIRSACIGERYILKTAMKGAVVHDRSYMDCWVGAEAESIVGQMKATGSFTGCNYWDTRIISGEYVANGWIMDHEFVVSPFQVIGRRGSGVEIWTHPSARRECGELMEKVGLKLHSRATRFEIIGARSLELVDRLLQVSGRVGTDQGKVQIVDGLTFVVRDTGRIVDMIVDDTVAKSIWARMTQLSGRSIGVVDRHVLMCSLYHVADFPFDFPTSRAGTRLAALDSKTRIQQNLSRPAASRINTFSIESPFYADWRLVNPELSDNYPHKSDLQHVLVTPKGRGRMETNSHIYNKDELIGYITTAICTDSGSSIGLISISIDVNDIGEVQFQNPGSSLRHDGIVKQCPWSSSESVLIGVRRN